MSQVREVKHINGYIVEVCTAQGTKQWDVFRLYDKNYTYLATIYSQELLNKILN